jgi:hypothetical protein
MAKLDTFCDIPGEQYHAELEFLSKSMLSVFADVPARFEDSYIKGRKSLELSVLNVGTATHLLALEPDQFDDRFYTLPEGHRRDKRTEAHREQLAQANGRTMLTYSEYAMVLGMAESLRRNPKAKALLGGQKLVETSIFWRDKEHDVNLRCRPDVVRDDGIIVNLKTAASAKPEAFFRSAFDLHYDLSVAMECRGFEAASRRAAAEYIFLVIEKDPPHIIEAYNSFEKIPGQSLSYRELGEKRLRILLEKYKACVASNRWPTYNDSIEPMRAPEWQLKQMEA